MTHRGPFQPLLFCDSVISLLYIKYLFFPRYDCKYLCKLINDIEIFVSSALY